MKRKKDRDDHHEAPLKEGRGPVVPTPSPDAGEDSEAHGAQKKLHLLTLALTRFKALLFPPPKSELSDEEVEEKVEHLMKLTEPVRPKPDQEDEPAKE